MARRAEYQPQDVKTFFGNRIEDPALDNPGWKALAIGTEMAARLRLTQVEGALIHAGPGLVLSNHVNFLDIFILPWIATRTADRSLRIVSKDVLIHPEIKEDEKVLIRTGKLAPPMPTPESDTLSGSPETDPNKTYLYTDTQPLPKKPSIIKRVAGNLLDAAGNPILIHRGSLDPEFIDEVRETLDSGQLVGMFAQETRTPQNDISKVMSGPALLLRRYFPDIPAQVVTVAHQGELHRRPQVRISKPFTYHEISPDGKLSTKDFTEMIKDKMYNQLVQDVPDLNR
ncbi:MAG TPA: hypothetical protein VG935_04240 [Patescibacteria group bacterium]|nr:hypothetical protein [Patescibacteria group bacterium]